jgi:hypothetical protein
MPYTSDTTYGVQWQFGLGGDTEECFLDFHILKNAPAKFILSVSFLFNTKAYSKYECCPLDKDEDEDGCFVESAYFFTTNH